MWSVVLLSRSGSILEVLADAEPVLSGALAFAAGYGNSPRGVIAVIPDQAAELRARPDDPVPPNLATADCANKSIEQSTTVAEPEADWQILLADVELGTMYAVDSGLSRSEACKWMADWQGEVKSAFAIAWPSWAGGPSQWFAERLRKSIIANAYPATWKILLMDLQIQAAYEVDSGLSYSDACKWVKGWDGRAKGAVAIAWPSWAGCPSQWFVEGRFRESARPVENAADCAAADCKSQLESCGR